MPPGERDQRSEKPLVPFLTALSCLYHHTLTYPLSKRIGRAENL